MNAKETQAVQDRVKAAVTEWHRKHYHQAQVRGVPALGAEDLDNLHKGVQAAIPEPAPAKPLAADDE